MFPLFLMLGTIIQNPLVIDINLSKSSHKWVVGVTWTELSATFCLFGVIASYNWVIYLLLLRKVSWYKRFVNATWFSFNCYN